MAKIPSVRLEVHAFLSSGKILGILAIATKTPLEGNSWIESHCSVWISEAAIANCDIGVATRSVCLVTNRLSHRVCCCELLGGIRRSVDIGQEVACSVLLSGLVHGVEAAIVHVDVGVATAAIDLVTQAVPIVREVGDAGLGNGLRTAELPVARLILVG